MMNIIILAGLIASVNVALLTSKVLFPIIHLEIGVNVDEQLNFDEGNESILKRSLDNLGNGNILKRALGPGPLDPLGNGNIPKWSKKSSYTRDHKRSLDSLGNGYNSISALGPSLLEPLGDENIPKWSRKNEYTREYKRYLNNDVQFFRIVG